VLQLARLLPSPLANWLVGRATRQIRETLGGRMRVMITGMAPIRRSTLELMQRLHLPVYEAYGVTECGLIAWNTPRAGRLGSVGRPIEDGSISLAADGEILVRKRAPLTRGFLFEEPSGPTAATYLPSGEIATGDIGRFDEDGYLYITGRKKEIIVTQGGVKIHPEQLEAQIAECPDIERAVVLGNDLPFLIAVVAPRQSGRPAEARDAGIVAFVEALNSRLTPASRVGRTIVTADGFSVENGLLTRNLKVDRQAVVKRFQSALLEQHLA
jgi:long-chain acyl-CoA synthetase